MSGEAERIVAAVEKVLDEMVQYDSTRTMPNVRHQEHVRWAERIRVALRQPMEMPGGLLPDLRHLVVGGPDLPPEVFSQPLATTARPCDHEAQIRDLLEEREELLTEIRRLRMGNHPAGRALAAARLEPTQRDAVVTALREALEDRDAEAGGDRG